MSKIIQKLKEECRKHLLYGRMMHPGQVSVMINEAFNAGQAAAKVDVEPEKEAKATEVDKQEDKANETQEEVKAEATVEDSKPVAKKQAQRKNARNKAKEKTEETVEG